MKIMIYNTYSEMYEITLIEYTQFNGKDTIVEYKKDNETKVCRFEGWLSLETICKELESVIE